MMRRPGLREEAVDSLALIAFWKGYESAEQFEQPEGLQGIEVEELGEDLLNEAVRRARGLSRHGAMRLARAIQDSLAPKLGSLRKRLAAYYTVRPVARMMAGVTRRLLRSRSVEISDPFAGAGVTIWEAALRGITPKRVLASEIVPEAALACYASALTALRGEDEPLDVRVGDSFIKLSGETRSVDAILTNPPFTRWELLEKGYREFLLNLASELGLPPEIRGQPSLQAFALGLSEAVLKEEGVLTSVLPASTFYTLYGKGVVQMLKERFDHVAVVEGPWHSASDGSGFKEVVLIASRGLGVSGVEHVRLESGDIVQEAERVIGKKTLPTERLKLEARAFPSFLAAIRRHPAKDLLVPLLLEGLESGALRPGPPCRAIRGVEMYGPDFFLLPNRYWAVTLVEEDGLHIMNRSTGEEAFIPAEYLVPAFRKPEVHRWRIVAWPEHVLLALPDDLSGVPEGVRRYVRWGEASGAAAPAIRSFGPSWWAHVRRQVESKSPFSRLFLLDKLDPSRRGSLALYSPVPVSATKNFYLVECGDPTFDAALAAWYNSTIFLTYLLMAGREIGPSWLRFLLDDYKSIPTPDPYALGSDAERAAEVLLSMKDAVLPPLPQQIGTEERLRLDVAVLRMVGLEEGEALKLLSELYPLVKRELDLRAKLSESLRLSKKEGRYQEGGVV